MFTRSFLTAAAAVLVCSVGVFAASAVVIDQPAALDGAAQRVLPNREPMVAAVDGGPVDAATVRDLRTAASAAGGLVATGRVASVGLVDVRRDNRVIHAAPAGYYAPIIITANGNPGVLFSAAAAAAMNDRSLALNGRTAAIMGARVGDTLRFVGAGGNIVSLAVGAIVDDDVLGGNEAGVTLEVASRLGATSDTSAYAYALTDQAAFDAALTKTKFESDDDHRVYRSWDSPNPDSTRSTVDLKEMLGEVYYRPVNNSSVRMPVSWTSSNLTNSSQLLNETVRVRARCHVKVVNALEAAFDDVVGAGLAAEINVDNTNRYGGCWNPRYTRSGGFLSRHAYGIAIDMNTVANCQGCKPVFDCELVRIFRRHGFAWGGNFRVPDGMHFEWVGEPRHDIAYDSTYCPNITTGSSRSSSDRNFLPDDQSAAVSDPDVGSDVQVGADVLQVGLDLPHDH